MTGPETTWRGREAQAQAQSQSAARGFPTTPGTKKNSENRGLTPRALQTHGAEPTEPTDTIKMAVV